MVGKRKDTVPKKPYLKSDRFFSEVETDIEHLLIKKMKKILYLFVILLSCSCCSSHYVASNIVGVYIGFDGDRKSGTGYNYLLELKEDGTCEFIKYQDLYRTIGIGRWTTQGKCIVIEYDNRPSTNISDALMAGSYLRGIDTIQLFRSNKLRKENVILRKKSDVVISNLNNSLTVTKVKKMSREVYVIYASRNDSIFKIVSFYNGKRQANARKLKKGDKFQACLFSQFKAIEEKFNIIPPCNEVIDFHGVTIGKELDKGIDDVWICKDLNGPYF